MHSRVRSHVCTLGAQRDSDSEKLWGYYAAILEHTHCDLSAIETLTAALGGTDWTGLHSHAGPQQRWPQVTVETASPGTS